MITSDITDYGYEAGTFKLGQVVYHVKNMTHRFRFRKKCVYCEYW